jgi:hypothetical protein
MAGLVEVAPKVFVNPNQVTVVRENTNRYEKEAKTEIILGYGDFYLHSPWDVLDVKAKLGLLWDYNPNTTPAPQVPWNPQPYGPFWTVNSYPREG